MLLVSRGAARGLRPLVALALAYGLLAVIGLQWAAIRGAGSPVWPAAGVGFAGLLLGGVRLWPAILIGRLAAGLITGSSQPFWVELLLAGGNVVGTVLPVLLLQRFGRIDLRLITMRDVLWLAGAAALGAAISGAIGTGALWAVNGFGWNRAMTVGSNWWFGNLVGTLTVASLVLAWRDGAPRSVPLGAGAHLLAVVAATTVLAYLVFLSGEEFNLRTWHMYPALVWAALAFQVRGAALTLLITSVAALIGATLGLGPFLDLAGDTTGRVYFAQEFAAATSLTILILAAVADERRGKEVLARLNADLEHRVEEGAARLAQLQKMESVGQLTGGIAHDFNNLLMAVQGSLELLKKRLPADDERAARLLANAMEGARRGVTLTQRLLAFARKQELRPEAVDIPNLVIGMSDLLKRSLGPQIRIETRLALGLPKALVDTNQLEMAILNLAVNARDAMPDGGSLILVAEETRMGRGGAVPPGRYVALQAIDTGSGMDEATLRQAAEPFFTTKGVGKGTGLGLSMVHGLAEQSGGRFTLRSEQGRGTTAELLLPVAPDAAGEPEAEGLGALPTQAAALSDAGGLSVLVVDDDGLVRMSTADMVEDAGHAAVEAGSGAEALAVLRSGRPIDAVVTDQAMPGMTGVQLAAVIRAEFPSLPIILASGYGELPLEADRLIATRLSKPFRQADLTTALTQASGGAETSDKVVPLRSRRG